MRLVLQDMDDLKSDMDDGIIPWTLLVGASWLVILDDSVDSQSSDNVSSTINLSFTELPLSLAEEFSSISLGCI